MYVDNKGNVVIEKDEFEGFIATMDFASFYLRKMAMTDDNADDIDAAYDFMDLPTEVGDAIYGEEE